MGAIYFYHMTGSPLNEVLPTLLGRSLSAGWTVLVRTPSKDHAARLDELLWLNPEDGFLPHGVAGTDNDADHPVLLTDSEGPSDRPAVVSVDGASLSEAEVKNAERSMVLFDGRDPAAVEHARDQWRSLTKAGCSAQYWSQESGKWEMKAESGV